jgi:hypothetical protein
MRARERWIVTLALAGLAACGNAGPSVEITEQRVASKPSSPVLPGATAVDRFMGESSSSAPEDPSSDNLIAYDLPQGWTTVPPTKERYVNLHPAGDPEASCYLSFLPGGAGGLAENVNRWRKQFGAAPLPEDAVAALPERELMSKHGKLVEVEGVFSGMGDMAPRAGFALLGVVVSEESGSLFLKFTGPAPLVAAERERFETFARSLRLSDSHGSGAGMSMPPGASSGASGGLGWKAPEGWSQSGPKPMREVTFTMGLGGECYITRLPSEAGGLRGNIDRWCGQLGRERLTDEAFAALERVDVLGQSVPVLEIEGTFTGMDGKPREHQGLLAVACIRPSESLFIKLTGPEELVHAERANFRAFVSSLVETR